MAGHLALILPKRQKLSRSHHAAMNYAEVPAFIASLRERETTHTLALEFLILTAARVGEVLGAQWSEIDIALRTWIIPASRMKASREHRIPLWAGPWRSSNGWPSYGAVISCFPASGADALCLTRHWQDLVVPA